MNLEETKVIVQKIAKAGLHIKKVSCPSKDGLKIGKKKHRKSERKTIQIKSTTFVCVMCVQKFTSYDELRTHMRSNAPCRSTSIPCPVCGKTFVNRSRCKTHVNNNHKEKTKYSCEKCGKEFTNPIALQAHLDTLHTEYFDATTHGFSCKLCHEKSQTKPMILHHINSKHLHVSTLLCETCGKSFLNESGLRAHILTHNDSKPHLCQICPKSFKLLSTLKAHIKTHCKDKRYVCEECGKAFKKNSTLLEHKKHHAGDFSFACNVCAKKFVSKSACNSHLKTHIVQITS